jgi:hypothetical protein
MKTKLTIFAVSACFAVTACKESGEPSDQSTAPAPEVRGAAIAKLDAPEPKPVVEKPKPETNTAPALKLMVDSTGKAILPTADLKPVKPAPITIPDKPVQVAVATVTQPEKAKPAPAPKKPVTEKTETKPAPKPAKVATATQDAEQTTGEFQNVDFEKLASFEYEVPEEEYDPDKEPDPKSNPDQIPATIKAFNKKRVALKGFMLPLKVEDGLITELLIMRDQSMCCYGTVPKINEWVSVRMTGKGVKPIMDQAVTIYGRLKVGEIRENGYLVGIYEMDGEKLTGPLDL